MQLALFPAPPAPLQLALELPTSSTTTSTPKGPNMTTSTPQRRRGPLRRLLDRISRPRGFGGPSRPFPSSTTEITPDDWRVILAALQRAVVEHTAANRWPAAEAAQRTLDKVAKYR